MFLQTPWKMAAERRKEALFSISWWVKHMVNSASSLFEEAAAVWPAHTQILANLAGWVALHQPENTPKLHRARYVGRSCRWACRREGVCKTQLHGKLGLVHLAVRHLSVIPFKDMTIFFHEDKERRTTDNSWLQCQITTGLVSYHTTKEGVSAQMRN